MTDDEIPAVQEWHRSLDDGSDSLTDEDVRAMTHSTDLGMAPARAMARELLAARARIAELEAERAEHIDGAATWARRNARAREVVDAARSVAQKGLHIGNPAERARVVQARLGPLRAALARFDRATEGET